MNQDLKLPLYEYQKEGVQFLEKSHGRAIIADAPGCIAGDEIIIYNRGGNARQLELRELYKKMKGGITTTKNNHNYQWDLSIQTKTRTLTPDGLFELNKIKNIISQGIKDVFLLEAITEENKKYSLKLTADHRIATPEGWRRLDSLKLGETIIVNGEKTRWCNICKEKTAHADSEYIKNYRPKNYKKCKKCIYRYERDNYRNKKQKNPQLINGESYDKNGYIYCSGFFFHPSGKQKKHGSYKQIFKHILVYEAYKNDLSFDEWKYLCSTNQIPAGAFFVDSKKFAIHHKNGDKTDNTIGNLEMVTKSDHGKKHGKEFMRHLTLNIVPFEAKITSIKYFGKIDTYDIQMDGPNKNFIASGVVVHNCGKSAQAIGYLTSAKIERTLIICPASVKSSWEKEIEKWTDFSYVNIDSKTQLNEIDKDISIWIINYDILKKHLPELQKIKFDCCVIDEAHRIKTITTCRTKASKILTRNIPKIILLTGTPLLSKPIELYTLLNILDEKTWCNYYDYGRRYCGGHHGRWGWDVSGATNTQELHDKIKGYFIRRKKEDVLKELPPKNFIEVPVDLDQDLRKIYEVVEDNLVNYLKQYQGKQPAEIAKAVRAEKLTQLSILRQMIANGGIPTAIDLIESILESDEKLLVFSSYREPLDRIKTMFGDKAVMITGETPVENRGEIVRQFQENPNVKIFLGGYKSAGEGITLTAASNVLCLDYPWTCAEVEQALNRAHRPGAVYESLTIYQIHVKETIATKLKKILERKQKIIDQVIDGKHEIESEANMVEELIDDIVKRKTTLWEPMDLLG